jgi:hypothetical protein
MDTLIVSMYKGRKRVSNRLISWWDRGPYSHCEITFSDGLSGSASFLDGGVRLKYINFDPEHWDRFVIKADSAYARQWFYNNEDCAYDVWGDARFIVSRIAEDQSSYFCSEAFMAALKFNDSWRFTPNTAFAAIEPLIINRL